MKKLNLLIAFSLVLSAFVFFACSKEDSTTTTTSATETTEVNGSDRGAKTCCSFYLSALRLSPGTTATLTFDSCLGNGVCKGGVKTVALTADFLATTTRLYCCPGSTATLTLSNNTASGGTAFVSFYGQNQKAGAYGNANMTNLHGTQSFNFDPCFNDSFEMAIE